MPLPVLISNITTIDNEKSRPTANQQDTSNLYKKKLASSSQLALKQSMPLSANIQHSQCSLIANAFLNL